jgi:hypothetical protein
MLGGEWQYENVNLYWVTSTGGDIIFDVIDNNFTWLDEWVNKWIGEGPAYTRSFYILHDDGVFYQDTVGGADWHIFQDGSVGYHLDGSWCQGRKEKE